MALVMLMEAVPVGLVVQERVICHTNQCSQSAVLRNLPPTGKTWNTLNVGVALEV